VLKVWVGAGDPSSLGLPSPHHAKSSCSLYEPSGGGEKNGNLLMHFQKRIMKELKPYAWVSVRVKFRKGLIVLLV